MSRRKELASLIVPGALGGSVARIDDLFILGLCLAVFAWAYFVAVGSWAEEPVRAQRGAR